MNEQLQQALTILITTTLDGMKAGATFLNQELPDVIQQLLLWKGIESFLYFMLGIGIIVSCVYFLYRQYNYWTSEVETPYNGKRPRYKMSEAYMGNLVIAIPILTGIIIFINELTWLQIWLAPKVYLIEYARTFIK